MVDVDERGQAVFRIFLPDADRVQILGGFTSWDAEPIDMLKGPSGFWTAHAQLSPGDHEFQYLVDERAWLADYAAQGVRRNSWGVWVSLLHVPTCLTSAERRDTSRRAA